VVTFLTHAVKIGYFALPSMQL